MSAPAQAALRAQIRAVLDAGPLLWRAGGDRRAVWLGRALSALRVAPDAQVCALSEQTGLSREMVRWALESTLSTLTVEALRAFYASVPLPQPRAQLARPGQLCAQVLAGNVFTAAARAIAIPLLFGAPVVAKAASDQTAFVSLLAAALTAADPELARAFSWVELASEDEVLTRLLFEQADVVSVYGSDETLRTIRAQLAPSVSFVGHGHGLGAAFVASGALQDEATARAQAARLALDVAAYDQRGCLSPLVAWVSAGQAVTPQDFSRFVFEALGVLATRLPRGRLAPASASAQLSFRGIAALRGTVFEGEGYAVCYEGDAALRVAPGYRNLQVVDLIEEGALAEKLAPLGTHLKCLGIAGVHDEAALIAALPARVAPRVCPLGTMQEPKLDALQDGVPAWEGLVRYVERDT